jgi:hypothetical protein
MTNPDIFGLVGKVLTDQEQDFFNSIKPFIYTKFASYTITSPNNGRNTVAPKSILTNTF